MNVHGLASVYGVKGCQINPSWWTNLAFSHSRQFSTTYIAKDVVSCLWDGAYKGRKETFYLTTHSTHFIYSYMASDIW